MVELESELLSVNLAGEKQTIEVVDSYQTRDANEQLRDINKVYIDKKAA